MKLRFYKENNCIKVAHITTDGDVPFSYEKMLIDLYNDDCIEYDVSDKQFSKEQIDSIEKLFNEFRSLKQKYKHVKPVLVNPDSNKAGDD